MTPLTSQDMTNAVWTKSERSHNGADCIEVAHIDGGVAIRNSNLPDQVIFAFTSEWDAFTGGVQDGQAELLP
ncbi:hypothetical protein AF335_28960 [Streptomyces eurocidicus]|uniref:DUF397 domain-containing protein n=1 Tax=Streptomyces eurocidicus TaxID=66423 RepID=A0A2N8NP27_STREU|nr:DUF397 domain-containing protein [Streptomyces eurocidicus]MBB5123091.1 hypothetical protein [Streptomyces eurocidicus]MBF6056163.1 DUF397 domain-containing protein [Streptomyces eurocidicus]PNE30520.1 hypothetical protein AF335_28960 [Streptomyces eurocidicus]